MRSALLKLETSMAYFAKRGDGEKSTIQQEVVQPRTLDFLSWAGMEELQFEISHVELMERLGWAVDQLCGIEHPVPFWHSVPQKQESKKTASLGGIQKQELKEPPSFQSHILNAEGLLKVLLEFFSCSRFS